MQVHPPTKETTMGAYDFKNTVIAKTAKAGFAEAADRARYEYGHGGYTGSIAEKSGFVIFTPAKGKRWTVELIKSLIWEAEESNAASKRLTDLFGASAARQLVATYNDKWGPAICIELPYSQTKALKARRGVSGTQGKAFCFFGIASS
jgi:hypothetical protein